MKIRSIGVELSTRRVSHPRRFEGRETETQEIPSPIVVLGSDSIVANRIVFDEVTLVTDRRDPTEGMDGQEEDPCPPC